MVRPTDPNGNDLRSLALGYAIETGISGGRSGNDVVAIAEAYLKFLVGEDDENIPEITDD